MRFVGRQHEMSWLDGELARADRGRGRLVAVRGRRQVGKSRLLTEWVERTGRPSLYYQARGATPEFELAAFSDAARNSSLSGLADLVDAGVTWPSWDAALGTLARTLDDQGPAPVVVIDEFPYLLGGDSSIEGVLQAIWDHQLSRRPILLILVGSDLAMMETIATYGRPLYGRIDTQRQLDPLGIPDVADLLDVAATDAIDTYLMTGGFPKIIAALDEAGTAGALLDAAVQDEAHPLVFTGLQIMAADFPPETSARDVLVAIGHGERRFNKIQTRAGVSERTLATTLRLLRDKGVVRATDPRARTVVSGRTQYLIADPYLRFWLRFLAGRIEDISRGVGDQVAADVRAQWQTFAGRAIEPHVQRAIERLGSVGQFDDARWVGSYWTKNNDVEVDLVGTARRDGGPVGLIGAIKWREQRPFGPADGQALHAAASHIEGAGPATVTVGVSRTGFEPAPQVDVCLGPDDLVAALA